MKVTIIETDNWVIVFKDNEVIVSGHSYELEDVLESLGVEVAYHWVDSFDDELEGLEYVSGLDKVPSRALEG